MELKCETDNLQDYLIALDEVDYGHPLIQHKIQELFDDQMAELDIVRRAFEFVRDEISHSWDIRSSRITRTASDVLQYKEGICYAKSNLLAALLRAKNIPTGFCYQRLTIGDTPETGYCIHALNAMYLSDLDRWIRLDARGNKEGIQADFSIGTEKLAFPVRENLDEVDYPTIYARPNRQTMKVLQDNHDCLYMYLNELPSVI